MSKPQRRKGNAKTASSSAAAGYLGEGAVSLVGLTADMNIFDVVDPSSEPGADIDAETRIVLRKLVKKDPHTREKGLRELLDLLQADQSTFNVEASYEHFVGVVDRLATDGSPTVRLLTIKTVGAFIARLKKAASKGLKKAMPMVLFALSDLSSSVCGQAEGLLRENFPDVKRAQAFAVFAKPAVEMSVEIVLSKSELSLPTKYDDEETAQQRAHRLATQSLATIQKISSQVDAEQWADSAKSLFADKATVKKLLASDKTNLKSGLISVCLLLPNRVDVLIDSPLAAWCIASLDSSDDAICTVAWDAFVVLASDKLFYEKTSLPKTIIPRYLNVIRKKNEHWKKMAHFLLPSLALLSAEAKSQDDSSAKLTTSVLESMIDNLPFGNNIQPQVISEWATSLCELVQWALSQPSTEDRSVQKNVVDLIIRLCEEVVTWQAVEVEKKVAALIRWILEKNALNRSESQEMCQVVEFNANKKRAEYSGLLRELLSRDAPSALSSFHVSLLRYPLPPPAYAFETLAEASDEYFESVAKKLDLIASVVPTSSWSELTAKSVVDVVARVHCMRPTTSSNFKIVNDAFCRELVARAVVEKAKGSDNLCKWIEANLKSDVVVEMLNEWKTLQQGSVVAGLVELLDPSVCDDVLSKLVSSTTPEDGPFIAELLCSTAELGSIRQKFADILFVSLFKTASPLDTRSVSSVVARNRPSESVVRGFVRRLVAEQTSLDLTLCSEIASTCDVLLDAIGDDVDFSTKILVSQEGLADILDSYQYLNEDVIFESEQLGSPVCSTSDDCIHKKDEDLIHDITRLAAFAYVNVSIDERHASDSSHALGSIVLALFRMAQLRLPFESVSDELQIFVNEIREKLNIERARKSLSSLCETSSVLLAHDELANVAATTQTDVLGNENVQKWRKIYSEESVESFLRQLKESIESGQDDEIADNVFVASADSYDNWVLNTLVMRATDKLASASSIIDIEDKSLVDFLLCGIVTLFDSLHDVISGLSLEQFSKNVRMSSLAAAALRVFAKLAKSVRNRDDNTSTKEWNEFFLPTMARIIVHWFGFVRKDSQSTAFVRALHLAIVQLDRIPEDLGEEVRTSSARLLPELDAFNYSRLDQSLIIHAFQLLEAQTPQVQLIGLHVAKLLMPKMFSQENGDLNESGDELAAPKKDGLRVPIMLTTEASNLAGTGNIAIAMLLDLALVPFQDAGLSDEHRTAYCDVVTPLLQSTIPTLISHFPENIPRALERDYVLAMPTTLSPTFFEKYAANLLFRVLSAMPAVVRVWYKSLPTNGATVVHRCVERYISKLLIENELEKVKLANKELKKGAQELKIRVVPVTGEVVAEYTVEETTMRLCIAMPPDYPLAVPTTELDKAIVRSDRAKKWMLQLTAYLFYQNGSTVDGILMWRKNVDRDVEGAEACTICMMTIHSSSHQLPKVKCKQCKNKFHSNCLYKWFESSNQSSCPLCRANFT